VVLVNSYFISWRNRLGVSYFTNNRDDDKQEEKEKKDKKEDKEENEENEEKEDKKKNDNPFLGTWYVAAYGDEIVEIEFSKKGKCSIILDDEETKCTYEYDDENITLYNKDEDSEPIEVEYSVEDDGIQFGEIFLYSKRSKAKEALEKNNKNSSSKSDSSSSKSDSSSSSKSDSSSSKSDSSSSSSSSKSDSSSSSKSTKSRTKTYGFNDKFEFDGLELTIGDKYTFTTVDNKYSDYYGKTVVALPVTVKNLKEESHSLNMFFYDIFGSEGTEVKNVGAYFKDDVNHSGNLRTGASYKKNMYFLYDGDGTYAIEFDNFSEKVEVEFEIKK